jgi:hypothetical protein
MVDQDHERSAAPAANKFHVWVGDGKPKKRRTHEYNSNTGPTSIA